MSDQPPGPPPADFGPDAEVVELKLPTRDEPAHVTRARVELATCDGMLRAVDPDTLPAAEVADIHAEAAADHALLAQHYRRKARGR